MEILLKKLKLAVLIKKKTDIAIHISLYLDIPIFAVFEQTNKSKKNNRD